MGSRAPGPQRGWVAQPPPHGLSLVFNTPGPQCQHDLCPLRFCAIFPAWIPQYTSGTEIWKYCPGAERLHLWWSFSAQDPQGTLGHYLEKALQSSLLLMPKARAGTGKRGLQGQVDSPGPWRATVSERLLSSLFSTVSAITTCSPGLCWCCCLQASHHMTLNAPF